MCILIFKLDEASHDKDVVTTAHKNDVECLNANSEVNLDDGTKAKENVSTGIIFKIFIILHLFYINIIF